MRIWNFISVVIILITYLSCGSSKIYIHKLQRLEDLGKIETNISQIGLWHIQDEWLIIFNPSYNRFYIYKDFKLQGIPIPIKEKDLQCFLFRKQPGVIYVFPKSSNVFSVYSLGGRKIFKRKITMLKQAIDVVFSPHGYLYILDKSGCIIKTDYEGETLGKFRNYSRGGHFKLLLPNPDQLILLCRNGDMILYDALGHYIRTEHVNKLKNVQDICFDNYGHVFFANKTGIWVSKNRKLKLILKGKYNTIGHNGTDWFLIQKESKIIRYKVHYDKIEQPIQKPVDIF